MLILWNKITQNFHKIFPTNYEIEFKVERLLSSENRANNPKSMNF